MKRVSIQALKARLPAAVAEAESGDTILITRHNTPVAQLGPPRLDPVQRGKDVGNRRLTPAITRGTKGRYLELWFDDRANR